MTPNGLRAGVSLGFVTEIFQLMTKLQRNLNDQPSRMPKFWLAAVAGWAYPKSSNAPNYFVFFC